MCLKPSVTAQSTPERGKAAKGGVQRIARAQEGMARPPSPALPVLRQDSKLTWMLSLRTLVAGTGLE